MKFKNYLARASFGVVVATQMLLLQQAKAQDTETSMTLSLRNKSVLQTGFMPSEKPAIQYSANVKNKKWSLNIWADYTINLSQLREINFSMNVPLVKKEKIKLEAYLGYFTFPGMRIPDAQETGLSLTLSQLPIDISLYVGKLYGKNSGNGFAGKLQFSKDIDITDKLTLSGKARFGFNDNYFTNDVGFTHAVLTLGAAYKLNKSTQINLDVNVQRAINDFNGIFKNVVYDGLSVTKRF